MAIELKGNWKKGLALDKHTLKSTYLGDDENGHPQFDTERTEVGELVYKLKYKNEKKNVDRIIELIKKNISGIDHFDVIIPIPSTKKDRKCQPVELVSQALSKEYNVPILSDVLLKQGKKEEMKNVQGSEKKKELLKADMSVQKIDEIKGKKVLLIDDLYSSGATLEVATDLLYNEGEVEVVSVLTLTKTRSKR